MSFQIGYFFSRTPGFRCEEKCLSKKENSGLVYISKQSDGTISKVNVTNFLCNSFCPNFVI